MTKNYDNICFVFLRIVYYSNIFGEVIKYLTTYIYEAALHIIGSFSVASHYIIRLKNIFYKLFFQTLVISSIHTKASNHGDFTWGWILWLSGFGFYIFILLNKYITFRGLYILAEKILKKSKKVVKLGCFRLYNILGS